MRKSIRIIASVFTALMVAAGLIYFFFPGILLNATVQYARYSAGVSRHEIQVNAHRWVYCDGGKGDAVLFLHGYGMSKDQWGILLSGLVPSWRVIAPDLPGFGENSGIMKENYGVAQQAARLDAFVDKIGLRSFHIIGCSMGGGIAAYYAGEHPEKVKSLALIGPLGIKPGSENEFLRQYNKNHEKGLFFSSREDFDRVMHLAYDRPPMFPDRFVRYFIDVGKKNHDFNRKSFEDLVTGNLDVLESRLMKIKAPTLILWGSHDKIFPVDTASIFNRKIVNSKLVVLDAGHVTYVDEPEKTLKCYTEFLAGLKN